MIKKGKIITIRRLHRSEEGNVGSRWVNEKWKVCEVHRHLIVCENAKGERESFNKGELVMYGVIKSDAPELKKPITGHIRRFG